MASELPVTPPPKTNPLGDPALRKQLEDFVRRRVPGSDVDDVVQTVLCDALVASNRPADGEELRRWLLGIARHKVVDLHRRAHREPPAELPEIETEPPPVEERELVRWAEEQAGSTRDAQKTLGWMAREGEGEKLESIAADEKVPAARVRQRVSRMRRWMKERWLAELAAVAALALLAFAVWRWLTLPGEELPEARPERTAPTSTVSPEPSPIDRARALRADALEKCAAEAWQPCLDGLDAAKALDLDGDREPAIGAAREKADRALNPPPAPTAAPSAPTDSKAPENAKSSSEAKPAPKPRAKALGPKASKESEYEEKKKADAFGKKPSPPSPASDDGLDLDSKTPPQKGTGTPTGKGVKK